MNPALQTTLRSVPSAVLPPIGKSALTKINGGAVILHLDQNAGTFRNRHGVASRPGHLQSNLPYLSLLIADSDMWEVMTNPMPAMRFIRLCHGPVSPPSAGDLCWSGRTEAGLLPRYNQYCDGISILVFISNVATSCRSTNIYMHPSLGSSNRCLYMLHVMGNYERTLIL